jgi:hypothetical protein
MQSIFSSPFSVPLGAFLVAIVAIIGGIWSQAHARRVKADQRLAMLARGIPLAEVEAVLSKEMEAEQKTSPNPMRRLANSRLTALILISSGLGISIFFIILTIVLNERDVLSGAAIGVIPVAIGIGFLVDYQAQKRALARFGLEVEPDKI